VVWTCWWYRIVPGLPRRCVAAVHFSPLDPSIFIEKWRQSGASERANKDSFLRDLCDLLGVPHPDPATGDSERDQYVFERDAILVHGGDRHTVGKIDLYKQGCFVLEAKQGSERDSKKLGTARRGTAAWNVSMMEAFGQALQYASTIEEPPPFLIVTDIGYCFDLYASFDGSRYYRKFPDALSSRINLTQLADPANLATLRTIFTDPHSLDPSTRSSKVTREIAGYLANLAKSLDDAGHAPELVAKFLMRCLFTMFAEDVDLLPKGIFADALKDRWLEHPEAFPGEVEDLWKKMNEGGYLYGAGNIWQFNGGLFSDPMALPLTRQQLAILSMAATANWADVEPAIFGTLLERALDPKERHRLGAHFTPRAYVERLVRPTIEEPLREEWDTIRAQVVSMIAAVDPDKNKKVVDEARKIVNAFYDRLLKMRVLDPACGSGNFLFVALDLFKRIENEVIEQLDALGNDRAIVAFGRMVTPEQFLGIEIKPWAKEITELVLWIGWLQWQIRTTGWKARPPQPILRDYHNIECRDAVLAYDDKVPLLDDNELAVTRWDGETMKLSPVTGGEVPDETARIPVWKYVNPRKAEWPAADFIVGNPPFIGNWRMRTTLGDLYVESVRRVYPELPEKADFVLYWWAKATDYVRSGHARRFGLITTNSIAQVSSRKIVESALMRTPSVSIVFAIPDHPWIDCSDGAAVRIAMTIVALGSQQGRLCRVSREYSLPDGEISVVLEEQQGVIGPDLRVGARVSEAKPLASNSGLSRPGVKLHGSGFIVSVEQAAMLGLGTVHGLDLRIRQYRNGRDITDHPRGDLVIDMYGLEVDEIQSKYAPVYQWLLDRVKPERDVNRDEVFRDKWWVFGRPRPELRAMLHGLKRFVATVETAKHRVFVFLDSSILPDNRLTNFGTDDAGMLGTLSSKVHVVWSLVAGGRLEDRPVYNKTTCFDPFPFPVSSETQTKCIRDLGERLDAHRKRQQSLHPALTITGMYNVLEKLRKGEVLTGKEKKIHDEGLVSVLKEIHDELDAAVFDAYGWPHDLSDEEILERLVALNAERAEEERRGLIRWLRPEFQNPASAGATATTQESINLGERMAAPKAAALSATPWPKELPRQIAAVRDLLSASPLGEGWTATETARAFPGARKKDVEPVLDSLAAVGLLIAFDTPAGRRWQPPA
jgi:hypothetical protein